jgi:hypothetical protein
MYVYITFSPHNGITTGNVLILLFSPIIAIIYTALFCIWLVGYFSVFLHTRANFITGL